MAAQDIQVSKFGLSDKEVFLLIAVVKHNSAELKVNWNAVAIEMGHKDNVIVCDMFKKLKTRIGVEIDVPISHSTATRSMVKTTTSIPGPTPLMRHNSKVKKIKEEIIEDQDDDFDDDDLAPVI